LHRTSVIASTVPGNGDVNPYGVAVIPRSTGDLFQGNVLVSNFNDKANVQGTGTPSSRSRRPAGHGCSPRSTVTCPAARAAWG
jgi:hypothetical protein